MGTRSEFNDIWENDNRNKKSVTLDLSREGVQQVLYRMPEKAGVFVTILKRGQRLLKTAIPLFYRHSTSAQGALRTGGVISQATSRLSLKSFICASVYPISRSTSSVCSPSNGACLGTAPGVSESRGMTPGSWTRPNKG